ncbi:hypothetical protein KQX54_018978 [Cotesia glomerata]|uniref:Uncharacterized protein n=1 Tax=Cotesia glomerata TaxID=32391 RepID=A0AAV7IQL2_COTGL|nr:hypothetical protein KQX54_018978 [Cotesia glomerata]
MAPSELACLYPRPENYQNRNSNNAAIANDWATSKNNAEGRNDAQFAQKNMERKTATKTKLTALAAKNNIELRTETAESEST